ncbi:MAG: right-handed parallel beta-helix repeat-containing protein [FCB group bacterium]|nr:right-handed parallel beta-helix repeat-containing protein [FCB group bacterium]
MRKLTKLSLSALIVTALLSSVSFGQPTLSGNVTGVVGPGTYNVVGNCTVPAGQTLTILPGTVLQHTGSFSWSIYGTLYAMGIEGQMIEFISQNSWQTWGGIKFQMGSSTQSQMEWCIIDNGYAGNGGGLYVANGGMAIRHSEITNCQSGSGGAIYATNANALVIEDCYIAYCTAGNGGGLYLNNCQNVVMNNCEVAYNSATQT